MMGSAIRLLLIVGVVFSCTYVTHGIPGIASFSDSTLPSSCPGPFSGNLLTAVSPDLFPNSSACGSRYRIRCTGPTNSGGAPPPCRGNEVTVTVVDICPGCQPNQFDLSRQAFSMIADLNAGRITIDYTRV